MFFPQCALYTHSPLLYTGLKWAEREKIRVKWCQTAPFFCIFTRKSDATAHTGFEQTSLTFLKSVEKLAFPCFHALLFYKPWFQCPMEYVSHACASHAPSLGFWLFLFHNLHKSRQQLILFPFRESLIRDVTCGRQKQHFSIQNSPFC